MVNGCAFLNAKRDLQIDRFEYAEAEISMSRCGDNKVEIAHGYFGEWTTDGGLPHNEFESFTKKASAICIIIREILRVFYENLIFSRLFWLANSDCFESSSSSLIQFLCLNYSLLFIFIFLRVVKAEVECVCWECRTRKVCEGEDL